MRKTKEINFHIKLKNHFWFWGLYFVLNVLRWGAYFDDYEYSLKSNIIEFCLHIPLVYFNLFVLVPRYIIKPKYFKFTIALFSSLMLVYVLKTSLTFYLISQNIWPEANREYKPFDVNHIVAVSIGELYVITMASSIYLMMIWLQEKEQNRALKEEQFKIKLKYLKNQIQPHFFFNTLNNLYALSLEASDKVPEVILKLSNLMEYVLYEVKGSKPIPLIKEIEYIQNYIEIEKLRYENVDLRINIDSDIDDVKVPPLLFISLIENAFKHGGIDKDQLKIKINCKITTNGFLNFEVINSYRPLINNSKNQGIGLSNTKKRLKLIFKNNFTLVQKTKFNYHIIIMQIPILS